MVILVAELALPLRLKLALPLRLNLPRWLWYSVDEESTGLKTSLDDETGKTCAGSFIVD